MGFRIIGILLLLCCLHSMVTARYHGRIHRRQHEEENVNDNVTHLVQIVQKPADQKVVRGDIGAVTAMFHCVAEGVEDYRDVSWWHRGERCEDLTSDSRGSLLLWVSADIEAAGDFHCVAQRFTSNGELFSMDVATATLQVYDERPAGFPVLTSLPQDILVEVGDPIELNCSATGDPAPHITWYKDFVPIDINDPRVTQHSSGNLEISDSTISDGDPHYVCKVENSVGVYFSEQYVQVRECILKERFETVGDQAVIVGYVATEDHMMTNCEDVDCESWCLDYRHSWGECRAYSTRTRWWGCQCYLFSHEVHTSDMDDDTSGITRNRECNLRED